MIYWLINFCYPDTFNFFMAFVTQILLIFLWLVFSYELHARIFFHRIVRSIILFKFWT